MPRLAILIILTGVLLIISGCGTGVAPEKTPVNSTAFTTEKEKSPASTNTIETTPSNTPSVTTGSPKSPNDNTPIVATPSSNPATTISETKSQTPVKNTFDFKLYQKINNSNKNLFFSPYSITSAMSMVYAGAGGETARQMAEVLDFNLPKKDLFSSLSDVRQDLEKRNNSEKSQLNTANAIWGQEGTHFLPEYLDQINRYENGAFRTANFAKNPEQISQEINQWISDKTNKRINEMINPGDIDPSIAMIITNAIYFKAQWKFIFSGSNDEPFSTLEGNSVNVSMMNRKIEGYDYYKGENYQAVDIPYLYCDLSMLVVMPDAGQFKPFENSLDRTKYEEITRGLKNVAVELKMPKFKFESKYLLNEDLIALGIKDAFGKADFSEITDDGGLSLNQVLQSTFISVDENGTEAAAATLISVTSTSLGHIDLTINRPFIFFIKDNKTGTILFMGRVLNPNQ